MKKFYIYKIGLLSRENPRHWLRISARNLPKYFTLDDIEPNMFAANILKRLKTARDGTKIPVYKGRGMSRRKIEIGIKVIDSFARKLKSGRLKKLRKRLDEILQFKEVKEYIEIVRKLGLK